MEVVIRQIAREDATAVTMLCSKLGYTMSLAQVLENINAVLGNSLHNAFVAVRKDEVIGWIGVAQAIQIETPAFCEVRGLIVDDRVQKQGIGKMLIEAAKEWGKKKGFTKLRLRCNMKRADAHGFYRHIGFTEIKQQTVFEMNI